MRFSHFLLGLYVTIGTNGLPLDKDSQIEKRDDLGSYSTNIQSIETESTSYDPGDIADHLTENLKTLFYSNTSDAWYDSCNLQNSPVVWQVALAGKVMANSGNRDYLKSGISALESYRSSSGGYSASTARNNDMYTDDNAQVAWVYAKAFDDTYDRDYYNELGNITDFLMKYEDESEKGGVLWLINGNYIALISTLEAARAALMLFEKDRQDKYIKFAKDCINWTIDNLLDTSDTFIWDGMDENGNINQGKLTYQIGVIISCCAYLAKLGDDDKDWKAIGIEFGVKFISGGTLNNQFFTNGHINDAIERSHLVFVGFADLLDFTYATSLYQRSAFKAFKQLIVRESRYLYDTYESALKGESCPNDENNTLLKYSALSQIFYEVKRVVNEI